jgi:biopolymer transport protein ExbD
MGTAVAKGAAMKLKLGGELEKLEMNMTPMIDVCFQLIIFFMVSLRLFSPEGDFSIAMPLASPSAGQIVEDAPPPMKVRLRADSDGNLAGIQMGQRTLLSFKDLRSHIFEICRMDRGPGAAAANAEVEIDSDYNLKFRYIMDALTAVAGYVDADKQTIVRMIEKIRFAPPRKQEE